MDNWRPGPPGYPPEIPYTHQKPSNMPYSAPVKEEYCSIGDASKTDPEGPDSKYMALGGHLKQEVDIKPPIHEEDGDRMTFPDQSQGRKRRWGPPFKEEDLSQPKKSRFEEIHSDAQLQNDSDQSAVTLDGYNSDLSLVIDNNRLSASPLPGGCFAYMWHGVRATYGYTRGRVCFEVTLEQNIPLPPMEEQERHPHVLRVGWSLDECGYTLGEEQFSWGYGGTAKASTNLKFKDYGCQYKVGDVVGAYLDLNVEPAVMSFTVNGNHQGIAYELRKFDLKGRPIFPHILTKNIRFSVNFGDSLQPLAPILPGFTFVGKVPLADRVQGSIGPSSKQDCEAVMMVGLPASGKTTWVQKYTSENRHMKYNVLGSNDLIDKMKVDGLARKRNYSGRWDVLIKVCMDGLNKLLQMAYNRPRNYIIDQTNVYQSARKRKMKGFGAFKRRAIVICPSDEDIKARTAKREREEGKDVPDAAVYEMKANYWLPDKSDPFDSVEYIELNEEEAQTLVVQYNEEGWAQKGGRGGGHGPSRRGRGDFRGGRGRGWDRNSSAGSYGGSNDLNRGGGGFPPRGGGPEGFSRGGRGSSFGRRGGGSDSSDRDGGPGSFGRGGGPDSFSRGGGPKSFNRGGGPNGSSRGGGPDSFSRGGGSDSFSRGGGSDSFSRGGGPDSFSRGGGPDGFSRGGGPDGFSRGGGPDGFSRGGGPDSFSRGGGPDSFSRGGGLDSFSRGGGPDGFNRGGGSGRGSDRFNRGGGTDSFSRGRGSDSFSRGRGSDSFSRGRGSDRFNRGGGSDSLSSGRPTNSFSPVAGDSGDNEFGRGGRGDFESPGGRGGFNRDASVDSSGNGSEYDIRGGGGGSTDFVRGRGFNNSSRGRAPDRFESPGALDGNNSFGAADNYSRGSGPNSFNRGGGTDKFNRDGGPDRFGRRGGRGPDTFRRGGGGPDAYSRGGGGADTYGRGGSDPGTYSRGGGPDRYSRGGLDDTYSRGGGLDTFSRGGGGGLDTNSRGGGGFDTYSRAGGGGGLDTYRRGGGGAETYGRGHGSDGFSGTTGYGRDGEASGGNHAIDNVPFGRSGSGNRLAGGSSLDSKPSDFNTTVDPYNRDSSRGSSSYGRGGYENYTRTSEYDNSSDGDKYTPASEYPAPGAASNSGWDTRAPPPALGRGNPTPWKTMPPPTGSQSRDWSAPGYPPPPAASQQQVWSTQPRGYGS